MKIIIVLKILKESFLQDSISFQLVYTYRIAVLHETSDILTSSIYSSTVIDPHYSFPHRSNIS